MCFKTPSGPHCQRQFVVSSSAPNNNTARYYEISSYNSCQCPVYPGRRLPASYIAPFTQPVFTDGSMGKSDPTLMPQYYDESFPSLPFVLTSTWGASNTVKRPEYMDLYGVWQSDDGDGFSFCQGYAHSTYIDALVTRRQTLEKCFQKFHPFNTEWPGFVDSWEGLLPSDLEVRALGSIDMFASFVPKMASIQRRFKIAESWLTMAEVLQIKGIPCAKEDFPAVLRTKHDRFIGLWGNGLTKPRILWWFQYAAELPIFWIRQCSKATESAEIKWHYPVESSSLSSYVQSWETRRIVSQYNEEKFFSRKFEDSLIAKPQDRSRSNLISGKAKATEVELPKPPPVMNVKNRKWERFLEKAHRFNKGSVFIRLGKGRDPPWDSVAYYDRELSRELYFSDGPLKVPPMLEDVETFGLPCPKLEFFETDQCNERSQVESSRWIYKQKIPKHGTVGSLPPNPANSVRSPLFITEMVSSH
jgi:hypothetical protein